MVFLGELQETNVFGVAVRNYRVFRLIGNFKNFRFRLIGNFKNFRFRLIGNFLFQENNREKIFFV